jgi:hypothetical protein
LSAAVAQNFEVTGQIGGEINSGVDLSTSLFQRLEVRNGLNYGVTAGYLRWEHFGVEFQWNRNHADTVAQPINGGNSIKLFNLAQNQYIGNVLFHFINKDRSLRPFVFVGLGANSLSTNRSGVSGSTRVVASLGGGVKLNMSRHFGLRGQIKWTPTYLGLNNNSGYWCDPVWGGCWAVGNNHYLHDVDFTAGITLRF